MVTIQQAWNGIGLVLALVGMLLLFSFGMPSRRSPEFPKETRAETGIYYALGWVGLLFLIFGFLAQLFANFL
jgi:hypothetical protein